MAWVFLSLAIWLAAGRQSAADANPGDLQNWGDLLRREGNSASLSEESLKEVPFTGVLWASTGDDTGMHHDPSEYLPASRAKDKVAELDKATEKGPVLASSGSQSAPVASRDRELPESIHILPSNQAPSPAPAIRHPASTPSDRQLLSPRPAALANQHRSALVTSPECNTSDTANAIACLTLGHTITTSITTTTPLPDTESGSYQGNSQTGATTGEMNTDGIWHWGKTVHGDTGVNGGWQWLQTPDGDWNLFWVTGQTGLSWKWMRPNSYRWSGGHRRRGTWAHISGPDFSKNKHSLAADSMLKENEPIDEFTRGGGWATEDGNWDLKGSSAAVSMGWGSSLAKISSKGQGKMQKRVQKHQNAFDDGKDKVQMALEAARKDDFHATPLVYGSSMVQSE